MQGPLFFFSFAAALLLRIVLAGAGGPAQLPVEIVLTGTGGTAPPPAAEAAGFGTLALNSDFTVQLPPNWLGGCAVAGSGSPDDLSDATGHTWWLGLWWFNGYEGCWVAQMPDPVTGQMVLDIPWRIDSTNFNYGRGSAIQTAYNNYNIPGGGGQANTFPINAYYEVVARQTPVLPASFFAAVTWAAEAIGTQGAAGIEDDIIELDTGNPNGSDAAVHNWANSSGQFVWVGPGSAGLPPDFDPTKYHKFGMRTTSDGVQREICSYIDNVFRNCIPMPGGLTPHEATQRLFLNLQTFCDAWNYNQTCNGNDGQFQHLYVKSVRVWSCSSWETTQCLRPVLTGAP